MKLNIKIAFIIMLTLLLLICLSGFLPVFSQAPTDWVITGRVIGPRLETTEDIANWIPVTNAIVTLIDIEEEIHIVTTGEDGYYFFKNLAVDDNCVITAIAIVNGKTMVLKDVIPYAVAAPKTYDAGTADAESTTLALIVEELTKQGLTYEDIDLEIIQESDNFEIVGEQVLSVLEDNGNIMEEIIVAGEEVDSEEVLEETGDDASDFTVTDEVKGTAYKVTVTLREKISDDDPSAGTTAQTIRDTYTINASFIGRGTIEPSGAVTVNNGSSQIFTITPERNYHIVGITVDGNLEVGPFGIPYTYTFTNVTNDHTIEAYLAIDTYAIAVIIGNSGSISPSGAITVNHDSSQTFTITPNANYHIDDVLVDGSSVGEVSSYTFDNVTEDGHSISATFAIDTYTLSMTTDADGTGSGTVSPAEGVHIYGYGDVIIISATADPGSTFTGWTGDAESENSVVILTITENKDVTASFTLNTYILTVNTGGNGAGTVTIDPVMENYDHGDEVTITTTADAISSDLTGWAGDNSADLIENDDGTYSITMDSAKSISATFTLKKVTLTVDVDGTGSGTVSPTVGVHTYNYGELVTIGAKPDTGYFGTWIATDDMIGSIFTGWSGDASGTSDLTLTMDSDKSVTATFTKKRIVTLTVAATGTGSGTVFPPVGVYTYNYGDVVAIEATPDTASGTWISSKEDLGSIFTGWNGDASGTGDLSLIMDSDKLITATFALEKVKLTMAVTGTGSGTVSPTAGVHTYDYGETVIITATADATSSIFAGWSGDASGTGDLSLIMDSDKLITATFALEKVKLTMAVTGTGSGTVSPTAGVHPYKYGVEVTITATADPSSDFTGWSGDASGIDDVTLTMNSKKSVTAIFTKSTYDLTMAAVSPAGGGTTSPASPRTYTYDVDTVINISARPNPGYRFVNWTGDASGTNPTTTVTMDADKTVTTNFEPIAYTLTVGVNPAYNALDVVVITPSRGAHSGYAYNSTETVSIDTTTIPAGYRFVNWTGDASGTNPTTTVTMDADKTVTANFAVADYYDCYAVSSSFNYSGSQTTFTYTVEELGGCQDVSYVQLNFGDSSWDVESSTRKVIFENGIKTEWKDFNETETFTITFDGRVEAEETGVLTIKTSTTEFSFTVYKPKDPYTITATAGANGSISPSGEVTVNHGSDQTFAITPDSGYQITDVVVDDSSVGAVDTYTFSNVTAAHTIVATFAIDIYTIVASADSGGAIRPSGGVIVNYGDDQSFSIEPDDNYHISGITVDGIPEAGPFVSPYTFSNVTADHTIVATFTFVINTYTITASAGSKGSISPSGSVTVDHGANQSFTITPDNKYHIDAVLVDGNPVEAVSPYTFTDVTADHTIVVSFKR